MTTSDHNYDSGSFYGTSEGWWVLGPTEAGPQAYGTGGEMAIWHSPDRGGSWTRWHQLTVDSEFNHTYARRPQPRSAPFDALWADGDPTVKSPSRLYIGSLDGQYWKLPETIEGDAGSLIDPTD